MDKSTSSLTPKSTSSSIPTSTETASKPIQIPVSKQTNQTNWLGVSDPNFIVGSPASCEAIRAILARQEMIQSGGSLLNNTAKTKEDPVKQNKDETQDKKELPPLLPLTFGL